MSQINLPIGAKAILQGLQHIGYETYVVGGCVRDSLLGMEPKDWDICTAAKPEIVKERCYQYHIRTIDTGLQHGTITVNMEEAGLFEVTTFRIDGDYSDGRHPDHVLFADKIDQDLSRRDFTINAIAFDGDHLVDPYGGQKDLADKVIRCVGDPNERFAEDALRILRAMRFSSVYGFSIDPNTAKAIHSHKEKLQDISFERIQQELLKMITGDNILQVLLEYSDVIATIIPEIKPCIGFNQNNPYHIYNVYDHIAHAVANYKGKDIAVAMTLLLHDIGKPDCYTVDHKGGHFHGHGVRSRDICIGVLDRLRFDNKTKHDILQLVLDHDSWIEPNRKTVCKWLNKLGEHQFLRLLDVRMADILAHAESTYGSRIERCNQLREIFNQIVSENSCFKISDLAINGNDIMQMLHIPSGPAVGAILKDVLDLVVDGSLNNDRDSIEAYLLHNYIKYGKIE